jgi:hypothetical protein
VITVVTTVTRWVHYWMHHWPAAIGPAVEQAAAPDVTVRTRPPRPAPPHLAS